MNYQLFRVKNSIENIIIFPFILIGRILSAFNSNKKEYEIYYFFPFYHTGGAEKVHALVAQATGGKNSIIFFTRKSQDNNFYDDFVKSGCAIKDISRYTDNKFLYFLNLVFRGIITGRINRQKQKPLVFNGQCNFGYKISPWLDKQIPQVELIHSYNTFSWIRIPFLPFISATIMISKLRIEEHLRQYDRLHIPAAYKSRIQYIVNGIPLPETVKEKDLSGPIKVLYVGRGTEEKRVHLVAKMAEEATIQKLSVEFLFMGEVREAIPAELLQYCNLLGHKTDSDEINEIYQQAHIVIITSYTEGFPIAIEEGMARGCTVMATPVGDIPVHVKNNTNGFLFSSVADEGLIVKEGLDALTLLANKRLLLKEIGERNIDYANKNFSIEAFNKSYRNLFNELRSKSF